MPASTKHAQYLQDARNRIADTRTKLANITCRISAAGEPLTKALSQVEHHLAIVESSYEQMTQAGDNISAETKLAFDRSWDDVAQSIKNAVARIS